MNENTAAGSTTRPSVRTRSFVGTAALIGLTAGAAVRVLILAASPAPSTEPLRWLFGGFLQDAAVFGASGGLALLASAAVPEALVRAATGLVVSAIALLHLAWAEAIVYFGHPPRREDLDVALDPKFVLWSLDRSTVFRASAAALVLAFALGAASARSRRVARAWPAMPRLFALSAAAAALAAAPGISAPGGTADGVVVALARLQRSRPEARAGAPFPIPPPLLPELTVRDLAAQERPRAWVSAARPLARRRSQRSAAAPVLPPGLKPNVVFILMEGVRAHEVGVRVGRLAGLTPNLDRLAAEGFAVERAYSPGTHTPDGELAVWYGLLATPHEVLMTARPDTPLTGLPDLLRAAGWRSFLWIHNSDQTFYREDRFYLPRGFRMIDGRDFDASEAGTNWGKSDLALAARTRTALDRLEEPFAAMMLTISNHHPFQLPPDARSRFDIGDSERGGWATSPWLAPLVGRYTVPMLRTIHYTDEAVGAFMEGARTRPWFARTIFVIASDHGLPILPLEGAPTAHGFAELRHGVPLVFWSPLLTGGRRLPGPASLVDVAATLAGLLALGPVEAGLGSDLLDPADDDPERPVVAWDGESRAVSVWTRRWAWHGTLPPGVQWNPERFVGQFLVDVDADPRGERDVSGAHPEVTARLARIARIYFDVYPWLVTTGRSGTP